MLELTNMALALVYTLRPVQPKKAVDGIAIANTSTPIIVGGSSSLLAEKD